MTQPVDARGAQGVQAGEHGTQVNFYVTEAAEVGWPVRVGVVPALADCYQGRRRESAELAASTAATRVLSGLGGVGKSQLAAAHARELADQLHLLLWLPATGRDAVLAGYAQAARELGRAVPTEVERAAEWFLAWLQRTDRRWLIVLDDLADPADLRGVWPDGPSGHSVVTTRRHDSVLAAAGRALIEVGLYTAEEARDYLSAKLADPARLDEADELAQDLEYLPLALAQAAAFILDRDDTCAGYRERLAERRRLVELFPPDAPADDYRSTVAATWAISVEAADGLIPRGLAGPLLQVCAVLDPNGFPPELVESEPVISYLGAGLSARDGRDALRNLARLNLVGIDPDGGSRGVRVHALVQRAALDGVDDAAELAWAAADGLMRIWPEIERDHRLADALRANVEVLTAPEDDRLWLPSGHPVLFRYAYSLVEGGLAGVAVGFWRGQLALARHALGADHHDVLAGRAGLAHAIGHTGDWSGAVTSYAELLADRERVLGRDHPDTLQTRASLARWRGRAGDPRGAADACRDLVADRSRVLGPEHRDTLLARSSLARWLGQAGDPDGAVAAYRELLPDVARVLGPDHLDTLVTRSRLARWRGMAGDPIGAATAFEGLVADGVRVLGADHRETLAYRHSLARWRGEAGDPGGAAADLAELVADLTRVLGPDHPDTYLTRHVLAAWRGRADDAAVAADVLTELLADRREMFGPDHPDTVRTERDLAHWREEAARKRR
jgi:tetratricopeptide repeat protein/NB-ARC domain-containing protein